MRHSLTILAAGLFAGAALAADMGQVFRAADLKKEPFNDAETVAAVDAETTLSVLGRKGGWYEVKLQGGAQGWIRMTAVRMGDPAQREKGSSGIGSALSFLTTGRSGSSGVTAATGVRGLEPADVVNATPDVGAVKALDKVKADEKGARAFAAKAKLATREIGYLDAAKEPSTPSGNTGGAFGDF